MMDRNNPYEDPYQDETRPMHTTPGQFSDETQSVTRKTRVQNFADEDPMAHYQPIRVPGHTQPARRKRRRRGCSCGPLLLLLPVFLVLGVYLLFPLRTNILILGMDRPPEGTDVSRTDTNIVLSVIPLKPVVNMLSIPRDLWVPIANVGENRINTAHFFAEANQAGSGPAAAMQAVRDNFGLTIHYYVRIRFDGFKEIIDAMGGVTIDLPEAMSGYEAGKVHLNGEQALAFVRDRKGTDDFFRMQRGQMMIVASVKKLLNPLTWWRMPAILLAGLRSVDTNIPVWEMPRIGLAVVRGVLQGTIDARTIAREMVTPFTTSEGAQVLLPNWQAINPVLMELFGQ
jgi:polyisoprenyl-teichoic acid--peptidoglycan teichoic acid transferase